ncbi:hypothetical protein [Amycolatopsis taiwanensis]|uniref:Uncharacterized protein n=1 Tax=Amycolatopsis taiwanensis TaxID=342230 RepID=A0A9W6VD95_9PSEU|nr:hypothetical protein [Amycolatopsis taiwanensis]GLY67058.1 hypothetical protein Atai01_36770 [Amycolatopsis taiwanensis]
MELVAWLAGQHVYPAAPRGSRARIVWTGTQMAQDVEIEREQVTLGDYLLLAGFESPGGDRAAGLARSRGKRCSSNRCAKSWTGEAAARYRSQAHHIANLAIATSGAADTLKTAAEMASELVAGVRTIVRDVIASLVGYLLSLVVEKVASLGLATPSWSHRAFPPSAAPPARSPTSSSDSASPSATSLPFSLHCATSSTVSTRDLRTRPEQLISVRWSEKRRETAV